MRPTLSFFVEGIAKPAGSKRGFAIKKGGAFTGRVAIVDDNKNSRDWKHDVKRAALDAMSAPGGDGELGLWKGPLRLTLYFHFPRPKAHYRTGKHAHELRAGAPDRPTVKPDVTKLIRGVEDALTGIVWHDDAQIVIQLASKSYRDVRPGVQIEVNEAV
jgi:Holliday junction resolvase RusA-like endonuclease